MLISGARGAAGGVIAALTIRNPARTPEAVRAVQPNLALRASATRRCVRTRSPAGAGTAAP